MIQIVGTIRFQETWKSLGAIVDEKLSHDVLVVQSVDHTIWVRGWQAAFQNGMGAETVMLILDFIHKPVGA